MSPNSKASDIEILEIIAYAIWERFGNSYEGTSPAPNEVWQEDYILRANMRATVKEMFYELEQLNGIRFPTCKSTKKLNESLDKIMTIPARKAYLLEEDNQEEKENV